MAVDLTAPLAVGDTATFWRRGEGSNRSSRVWVKVLQINPERTFARVQLPSGNWPEIRIMSMTRLTKADPAEGRA